MNFEEKQKILCLLDEADLRHQHYLNSVKRLNKELKKYGKEKWTVNELNNFINKNKIETLTDKKLENTFELY